MVSSNEPKIGPGLRAPARFFLAALLLAEASPAFTQGPAQQPGPNAAAPAPAVPDPLIVTKLVWSAMAALDHANQTGNYSVLRDLGAPGFQAAQSAATLADIFQAIRAQRLDVGNALLVAPTFDFAPAIVDGGLLRTRGSFPLRPNGIAFDLLFQNVEGRWRIFGIAVVPLAAQPAPAQPRR